MIHFIAIGLLAGLLLASLLVNFYLLRHPIADAWATRARAAESQLHDLLDRISASERIELSKAAPPRVDADAVRYIPDTPDADARWNEWRGEPEEDEE
jgi:hypothetical protein